MYKCRDERHSRALSVKSMMAVHVKPTAICFLLSAVACSGLLVIDLAMYSHELCAQCIDVAVKNFA